MGQLEKLLTFSLLISSGSSLAPIHLDLIPKSSFNRPGTKLSGTRYITIHNTANTGQGANAKAYANPTTRVSWHFTVDNREIYQHLPLNEIGYHAGTTQGNKQSIGIDICENFDGNFEQAVKNAQELVAKLMKDLNVPLNRVVKHQHWDGKFCPQKLMYRWDQFLAGIGSKGKASKPCRGVVRVNGGVIIRAQPNPYSVKKGSVADWTTIQMEGRVRGSYVSGNPFWFKIKRGYISAYYINPTMGSGQPWCSKW